MSLSIRNLYKTFGNNVAVNNVNIELPQGSVLGLLGRNGAGKTTTLKMLLGLLQPNSGEILWNGKPLDRKKLSIGYLPEERGLYPKIKIVEQLRYFGQLEGLDKKTVEKNIDHWFERFEINEYKNKLAGELSKGNQQKVQIISTLLHNPELVILDEPFSGLDPVNADMLSGVIQELINQKKTIILSSHRMEQIEMFCENVCMLKRGETVVYGKLNEIKENYGYKYLRIESTQNISSSFENLKVPFEKRNDVYVAKVKDTGQALALLQDFARQHVTMRNFSVSEPSLHQIFVERVG